MLTKNSATVPQLLRGIIKSITIFSVLAAGLVLFPTLAAMQSKTNALVDFTISGNLKTDGANLQNATIGLSETQTDDNSPTELMLSQATRPDILRATGGLSGVFNNLTANLKNSPPTGNLFFQDSSIYQSLVNPPCTTESISPDVDISAYGTSFSLFLRTHQPNCGIPTDIVQTSGNNWFHIDSIGKPSHYSNQPYWLRLYYTAKPNLTGAVRQYSRAYASKFVEPLTNSFHPNRL